MSTPLPYPLNVLYADYDAEFALMIEECRQDNRHMQCSATHALIAEEYIAIQDAALFDCAGSIDDSGPFAVWLSAKRWGVAHSLYAALLAREGL